MSQEKVDKYKEQKANRKKIMKKEKAANILRKCIVGLTALVLVGWVGYSAYGTYKSKKPKQSVEIDYTAMTELSANLSEAAVNKEE